MPLAKRIKSSNKRIKLSQRSFKKFGRSLSFLFLVFFLCTSAAVESQTVSTILIVGDSLTEGYGVAKESAYPAVLESLLNKQRKNPVKVINAGIGGATSASALSSLKWSLRANPQMVILALGANDGLRGIDLSVTEANLKKAISYAKAKDIQIVLAGMKLPPNYGKQYGDQYKAMYRNLAKEFNLPLIPFLLDGVGGKSENNLSDGIHPNEKGHKIIAQTVKKFILKYLK